MPPPPPPPPVPAFRADLHLLAGYVYAGARIPCDLVQLQARQASDWRACTDGAVTVTRHDYAISPEAIAAAITDAAVGLV